MAFGCADGEHIQSLLPAENEPPTQFSLMQQPVHGLQWGHIVDRDVVTQLELTLILGFLWARGRDPGQALYPGTATLTVTDVIGPSRFGKQLAAVGDTSFYCRKK